MTYKEIADDALTDIGAFVEFKNLTTSDKLRAISEAIHEMQKRTSSIEKIITIDATTLDANGAIALDPSITVPRRGTYTLAGSTIASPVSVTFIGRDIMAKKRIQAAYSSINPNQMYVTLERNQLFFFPFTGLTGTFTLNCVAKMPIYATSRTTDAKSYWYGWDAAHLDDLFKTTNIPQEFEDAEEGITAYTAAKLLELIPEWRHSFAEGYDRRMSRFAQAAANIMENLPDYDLNYEPVGGYPYLN